MVWKCLVSILCIAAPHFVSAGSTSHSLLFIGGNNPHSHHPSDCNHPSACRRRRRRSSHLFSSNGASNDNQIFNDAHTLSKDRVKIRFRARVSYSGTQYHGWQVQPSRSSVQGEIESVLTLRFRSSERRVSVLGAGRTDAGVHARGQAIHFDLLSDEVPFLPPGRPSVEDVDTSSLLNGANVITLPVEMDDDQRGICTGFCKELEHSMNRMLPLDIRVFNLQLAPYSLWPIMGEYRYCDEQSDRNALKDGRAEEYSFPGTIIRPWHAIQSASRKWYSYRFTLGPTLWNPMERFTRSHFLHRPTFSATSSSAQSAHVREPYALTAQDMDRLLAILKLYEGTHDFKAFGGQLEQNEKRSGKRISTVRTVHCVELVKEPLKPSYAFGTDNDNDENELPFANDGQLGFIGEEGNYRIDFLLQGALYKMVRNMVGTAIEVWLGRMSEESLVTLLRISEEGTSVEGEPAKGPEAGMKNSKRSKSRSDNPCKPAPPEGLTLEYVYYEDNF